MMILKQNVDAAKSLTHEEAVARARALAPLISEQAAAAEAQRRLPAEVVQAMVEAGLVRLLTPARWGGHELGFDTAVETIIEIAKADASAGWCYSFFNMHSWMLALFPEQAQRDVWEHNPDALLATSFAPVGRVTPTEGGYLLKGNWPWSSGVNHSAWCIVAGTLSISAEAPPEPAMFLVPRSDYEILDTWFVAGLKASGSNNVLLKEVFVPQHRIMRLLEIRDDKRPGVATNPNRLYSLPLFTATVPEIVAPIVEAALGAYETWREASRSKFTAFTREQVAMFNDRL